MLKLILGYRVKVAKPTVLIDNGKICIDNTKRKRTPLHKRKGRLANFLNPKFWWSAEHLNETPLQFEIMEYKECEIFQQLETPTCNPPSTECVIGLEWDRNENSIRVIIGHIDNNIGRCNLDILMIWERNIIDTFLEWRYIFNSFTAKVTII